MSKCEEMTVSYPHTKKSQAGVTLMEMIAALAIIAIIIVGSLALYNAAQSSQASTQMVQDLTSVRAAVKQLWLGQGAYGTGGGTNLNDTLVASNRLPTTIRVDTTTTPDTLYSVLNGTFTITGFPTTFTIAVTNVPDDVCMTLLTNTTGWTQVVVSVSSTTITAFPITPAQAATACSGTTTLTYTSL